MEFVNGAKVSVSHLATTIPESVYMCFQMTFAIITPALIAGAFAERMKFSALLWFMALWSILVYAPIAHWVREPSETARSAHRSNARARLLYPGSYPSPCCHSSI